MAERCITLNDKAMRRMPSKPLEADGANVPPLSGWPLYNFLLKVRFWPKPDIARLHRAA